MAVVARSTEQQLVETSPRDGNRLSDLHRRFYRPLLSYFRKRIAEHVDPEDLVQEVFLRLILRADTASVQAWDAYVFTTAANVINDWARRRGTRCQDLHEEFDETCVTGDGRSPERVMIGKQALAVLIQAIDQMPMRTRQIFIMRRYEGLSNKQIASQLGISVSGVRFHSVNAKAILARCFEGAA